MLKTSGLEERHGLNVLVLLPFSGFEFLGGGRENKKNQKLSLINKHLLGIEFVARHHTILSVTFPTLKITFNHGKETSDIALLIPTVVPERPFLLRLWPKLGSTAGNVTGCFPWEPEF